MKRHGQRQTLPLLAGSLGLLLTGLALASAPPTKPRQENFASYSLYIRALVDYQRALDAPPEEKPRESADASKLCRDGGSDKEKKKNSCEGKYLMVEDKLPDNATRQEKPASTEVPPAQEAESLEEAISRAGYETVRSSGDGAPDFSPRGFPLQEISAQDLSESGVDGLLGLFDNVRMTNLGASAGSGGSYGPASGGSGSSSLDSDGTLRVTLDNFLLELSSIDFAQLASTVSFGDGYSIVSATVRTSGSGLNVGISSETYTPVYIVDRDGMPGTDWDGAGALTIDRLAILVPYVEADIQSVRGTSGDNSVLQIDVYSPGPITVGMNNTRIGVTSASRDGSQIGASTSIVEFGPQSVLTIDAGTRVSVSLGRPDGQNTAFVTLNGRVGDISLEDIRLVDHYSGGGLRIGRFAMGGINLVDTKVFLDEQKVIVDVGRGLTNVSIDIERLYLGSEGAGSFIGDFYARGGRINELRFTAEPH